ncbi:hypothetical protein [Raoultibacter massiliensis]|uniref:hypothetical protein n=1 Tax=Raoultibacter massiliensis TaxID=1852371 RepID=UPI003A92A094
MVDYPVVVLSETYRKAEPRNRGRLYESFGPPDQSVVERFVLADTDKKIAEFAAEWRPLLDYTDTMIGYHIREATLDDYKDARESLVLAMSLRSLLDNDECTIEQMERLGFRFDYFEPHDYMLGMYYDECGAQAEYRRSIRGDNYAAYISASSADQYTPINENQLVGASQWKREFRELYNEQNPELIKLSTEEHVSNVLFLDTVAFPQTHEGMRCLVEQALDELITVHLHDVRTASIGGGREYRKCGSLLSSLWYCMMTSFEGGRAGRCEACGKPFVSKGERGKPRKYCSPACSKWAQRHPGETR